LITLLYNHTEGSISFGWMHGKPVLYYKGVPQEPLLVPVVNFGYDSESVELI
jgi:hypothetical protein